MDLSETRDHGTGSPGAAAYGWPGILGIILVGAVLLLCCMVGMGLIIWAMVGEHMAAGTRIVQAGLGVALILAATVGFVLRGSAGMRLSLGCSYSLFLPLTSLVIEGGISAAVICASVVLGAIIVLHQPALLRFYRSRRPGFGDHALAVSPTLVFLIGLLIWG